MHDAFEEQQGGLCAEWADKGNRSQEEVIDNGTRGWMERAYSHSKDQVGFYLERGRVPFQGRSRDL